MCDITLPDFFVLGVCLMKSGQYFSHIFVFVFYSGSQLNKFIFHFKIISEESSSLNVFQTLVKLKHDLYW